MDFSRENYNSPSFCTHGNECLFVLRGRLRLSFVGGGRGILGGV